MWHISIISPDLSPQICIFSFACYLSMVMAGMSAIWTSPLTAWYHSEGSEVPMTEDEVSWMVSLPSIGAGISSIPCGILADMFGRKTILLGTGITSFISWLLIMTTRSKWVLCAAQVLGGIVLGGAPSVAPIYISEISPPSIRGAIVGQLNTVLYLSLVIVNVIGPRLSYTNYTRFCSSIPVLFIIFFSFALESPYYLMSKGRVEEAKECMKKLRGKDCFAELEAPSKEALEKGSIDDTSILTKLKQNDYIKRMICLQILSCVSMFNGSPTIPMYAAEFLGGRWVAMVIAAIFVVSSFLAAFLADPIGRRPLLVSSLIGAAIFTSVIAAYYIWQEKTLLYVGLFGFCFVTSVGINPLIMTLPSELFPTNLRAFANGLTQLTSSISSFICLKIFINVNESLGVSYNFFLYTVISLIGAMAGYLLPETAKSMIL